jgi:hypothetical protein
MANNDNNDFLFKELELVQGVINRFGNNSFLIKGWTITLIVATLLLENNTNLYIIAFLPLFTFWYLDAYFLRLERLYRKLYDWLRRNRLRSKEFLLDMNSQSLEKRFGEDVNGVLQIMFSKTLAIFYLLLLVIIVASIIINNYSWFLAIMNKFK